MLFRSSYAVELGLLPANPLDQVAWKALKADAAVNPQIVASPGQVQAILDQVAAIRPELVAFFGCLYYAALRPEEAVALRRSSLILPPHGWGKLILVSACPRTGSAWTSTGQPHEPRGLKHRPEGAIRIVPIPPILVALLRHHLRSYGTTPDGCLFHGLRGGMISESVYGRTWHTARDAALGPVLADTGLARRPYDLRHAALSLWLNASADTAEVATRAGNSAHVLQTVYTHCIDGYDNNVNRQIENALRSKPPSLPVTANGAPDRRHHPEPVRHMSVHGPRWTARRRLNAKSTRTHTRYSSSCLCRSEEEFANKASDLGTLGPARSGPHIAHKRSAEPLALPAKAGDAIQRHRL